MRKTNSSEKTQKAYKLLALQEGISNRAAKDLIDKGLVYSGGKKVKVARGEIEAGVRFRVEKIGKYKIIFEDNNIIAVDKPAYLNSEEIEKKIGSKLLHRLDRETSGILLFVKDEEFRLEAIEEFKQQRVEKEYIAWVEGKVAEEIEIDKPILTIKKGKAYSKISYEDGKDAYSFVEPMMIEGRRSKVKVTIKTGRTHQIRVHLKSIDHPIVGDTQYGGKPYKRAMLHAYRIKLFDYEFVSKEPKDFSIV